ncbi:MAG: RrF2 family transcriptional regulator [Gemmataceae bacterium]
MFSQKVEYALRAVVYLAAEGTACTVERIAAGTKVPGAYLAKVVQELVRGGLLRSQRGVGGGVALVRPAADLTVLDVVNVIDPIRRIMSCPLGLASHGVKLCPLHAKMDRAMADTEEAFRSTTLADLLTDPNPSVPLCDGPRRLL